MRQMSVKPHNVREGDVIVLNDNTGIIPRQFRVVVTIVDRYYDRNGIRYDRDKKHVIRTEYQIYHKPEDGGSMPYWWSTWYTKWDSSDYVDIERK